MPSPSITRQRRSGWVCGRSASCSASHRRSTWRQARRGRSSERSPCLLRLGHGPLLPDRSHTRRGAVDGRVYGRQECSSPSARPTIRQASGTCIDRTRHLTARRPLARAHASAINRSSAPTPMASTSAPTHSASRPVPSVVRRCMPWRSLRCWAAAARSRHAALLPCCRRPTRSPTRFSRRRSRQVDVGDLIPSPS